MPSLHSLSVERFTEILKRLPTPRACLVYDPSSAHMRASHDSLQPLADWLERESPDFAEHEAVFLEVGKRSGALMGAFLHKTIRGQGQGGLRFWPYETLGGFLTDGLRLAQGMGRKNALAGLWWGGGKGVIARPPGAPHTDEEYRRTLYAEYGSFVSSLDGVYVTAEDVGTRPADMASVFGTTRFVTCVPPQVGGSGNPSRATALGVVCAMEAALEFKGMGGLEGKRIAMQGVGNVATFMIDELLERKVRSVKAVDISEHHLDRARSRFADAPVELERVDPDDCGIFSATADILAPNALGGVLNERTIESIQAPIVCGAANNQLHHDVEDAERLARRSILCVPDFVANRMGIVNCANEQYGRLANDPAINRHFSRDWENSVFQVTRRVLAQAERDACTPTLAAKRLADELSQVPHPIWGHRSRVIIEALWNDGWHARADDQAQ